MRATNLLNSLMVSVLPAPASPTTTAPLLSLSEVTMLSQQRSVTGVIMKREAMPFYSQPYLTWWSMTLSLISVALSPSRRNLKIEFHSHAFVEAMLSSARSCS